MDLSAVDLSRDADVHLCGPLPFMRGVRAQMIDAGVPARRSRYEAFGPNPWLGAN